MTAIAEAKKFLSADEIVSRARSGAGGLIVWTIEGAYPAEGAEQDHPRVGRCNAWYTLEDGTWCRIPHKNAKAASIKAALMLDETATEWATAYDGPPADEEDKPFGIGGPGERQNLMAYWGRHWRFDPPLDSAPDPFEDGIECEICDFSTNDVGSVCYYEKKNGNFEMVVG